VNTARCKSCDAEIIWAVTEAGNRIPIDAEPIERPPNQFLLVEIDNEVVAHRAVEPLYITHFATCPHADEHRRTS